MFTPFAFVKTVSAGGGGGVSYIVADGDKKELEKRINQYVKEIDRCIAWLGE